MKPHLLFFLFTILATGCISRYNVNDQYCYDGTYYIPSTGWYARLVDITGEKYKALYLSKDSLIVDCPLDSINGPVIWINKLHDYPSLLISEDSIIIQIESFTVLADPGSCHLMKSATIKETYFSPDRETAKEMISEYSMILPMYPYSLIVFETWHNAFRFVPNQDLLKSDSTILHRQIEPLYATTKTFNELSINPSPLWWIRLRERYRKTRNNCLL